jgi:hypothetical protein
MSSQRGSSSSAETLPSRVIGLSSICLPRISSEEDKAAMLGEAEIRIMEMKEKLWYYLARELKREDHYQLTRAYSEGLQEWVEILRFYHYLT